MAGFGPADGSSNLPRATIPVEEVEKNSDDFVGVIRNSHWPVTKWLWVAYIVMVIWAIAYLIQPLQNS
jgi:hypothetical protein